MSLKSLIEKRVTDRLSVCQDDARKILENLRKAGISANLFGSVLKKDVHPESDIDILILDRANMSRGSVLSLAERGSSIDVDVLFAEDIKPDVLEKIMEEINAH
jgi:predicted nucleotidyltransferase